MKKLIAILCLVPFLFISCNVLDSSESAGSKSLTGQWEWEQSTGGFIGETLTPGSTGYTQKLVVKNTKKAFLYRNDQLIVTYTLSFKKLEWMEEKAWIFEPQKNNSSSPIIQYVTDLDEQELVLSDSCFDCYISYYGRTK